jgi:hypothetical protein
MEGTKVAGTVRKVIFSSARNCAGYMHQISHAFKTVMTCFCKARRSEASVSQAPLNTAYTPYMWLSCSLIESRTLKYSARIRPDIAR